MNDPIVFSDAVALIRAGQTDHAINLLQAALPDLDPGHQLRAHTYAGLACYFAQRWDDALAHFQVPASGSEIPEDHFNVARCQVRLGQIEEAHATWQLVCDLSIADQDAPETSSLFEKKLTFARLLLEAGACDERGLDLVARQLMGFFTTNRTTDAAFWGIRRVPPFEAVLETTRGYYVAMGKSEAEWLAYLESVAEQVDDEGREVIETMRGGDVRSEE